MYELWKVLLLHLNCSKVEEKCRGKERKRMSADCLGVVRLNEHEASEESSSQSLHPKLYVVGSWFKQLGDWVAREVRNECGGVYQ